MKQTVYVDILLALNFFINYFLMLSVGRILKSTVSRTRICLAAVFGAVCSLSVFLPPMHAAVNVMYKLAVSAGMVAIAYRQRGWRSFVRYLLVTCAVTFGFGGMMLAIWLTAAPGGMVYRNGVAYFSVSPEFIMLVTVLCYTLITAAGRLAERLERRSRHYTASVYNEGGAVSLRLMCDTGNLLTEPFSGAPVMVVDRAAVRRILPPRFQDFDRTQRMEESALPPRNIRIVPYSSVGGEGYLVAFRPDRVRISDGRRQYEISGCYIAVTDCLGDGEYDGLVHPAMLHDE